MRITKVELLNRLNDNNVSFSDKIQTLDLLFDFNSKSSSLYILMANQFLTYDIINYVKNIKDYRLLNELKFVFKCFVDLYASDKFDIAFKYIKKINNYKILKYYKVLVFNAKNIPNDEYEYILNEALLITNTNLLNEFNVLVSKLYSCSNDYLFNRKVVHYASISNNKLYPFVIHKYMMDNLDLLNDDILELYYNVFNVIKRCDLIAYNEYLFANYMLIKSDHYEFVLENALRISSVSLCNSFGSLACNMNLLESPYYQFTLTRVLSTKDPEKIKFINRVLDNHDIKYILQSVNYITIVNTILKIDDYLLLEYLYPLFINNELVQYDNYAYIIKNKIKEYMYIDIDKTKVRKK